MNRHEAEQLRNAIVRGSESLPDDVAINVPDLFASWEPDADYVAGDRRKHNGVLWSCIQPHHSQSDWTPDVAVSLWVRTSADEWPEWVQPTGAHDAYRIGDKVSHNSGHWVNTVDYNTYEPGVYGWDET